MKWFVVLFAFMLSACGKSDGLRKASEPSVPDEPVILSTGHGLKKLVYFSGGGYPGPHGPYFHRLTIEPTATGRIFARFESHSCIANRFLSKDDFDSVAEEILASSLINGVGSNAIDAPSSTIVLNFTKPSAMEGKPIHIGEDPTSAGEAVLDQYGPAATLVRAVLDNISQNCPPY